MSSANHRSGIDALLADVNCIDKQIQTVSGFTKERVRESQTVIAGKISKIKSRKEDSFYGREFEITSSIFERSDIDQFNNTLSSLRKEKQKLQDEILELNVRTEIELNGEEAAVLADEKIV